MLHQRLFRITLHPNMTCNDYQVARLFEVFKHILSFLIFLACFCCIHSLLSPTNICQCSVSKWLFTSYWTCASAPNLGHCLQRLHLFCPSDTLFLLLGEGYNGSVWASMWKSSVWKCFLPCLYGVGNLSDLFMPQHPIKKHPRHFESPFVVCVM